MRVSAELPVGVASLFGEAARARRDLERRLVDRLETRSYDEVILPILDYVDPYRPVLGEAARRELYRFTGRDGETVAVRSDFTPMLARLLAPRLDSIELPARYFYRGDVVRYRPHRVGARRELYQLGTELLGRPGDGAEREMLELFLELLAEGPGPVRVVLGVAGALDELLADVDDPAGTLAGVGRRERGVARRASSALLEVVEEGRPKDPGTLGPVAVQGLERLDDLVGRLAPRHPDVQFGVDLAEFAGAGSRWGDETSGTRSYYDGIVFRALVGPRWRPVGSGGRYDRLFERLGAPVSAVGFSLGLDSLLAAGGDD